MATWDPLRNELRDVEHSRRFDWDELDQLVQGLPPSASNHPAFWSGDRPGWPGFRATDVRVGSHVTFVRQDAPSAAQDRAPSSRLRTSAARPHSILLISCSKKKGDVPAAAKDLYTSALFTASRIHAETTGSRWFILSAEHGLLAPNEWLTPYDRYLPDTPAQFQAAWATWVAERLDLLAGSLTGTEVEIHAGAAYVAPLEPLLGMKGASVSAPLAGLSLGERLAWYGSPGHGRAAPLKSFVDQLTDLSRAVSPADFLARGAAGLSSPGLYSWWVDEKGADDLSSGTGVPVASGLIYAGLAGATKWPSGTRSKQTLWTRISANHLGGRARSSTFRLTLGSALESAFGWDEIDEAALTIWMHAHLRVNAIPFEDPDSLGRLEDDVLQEIDPPLNLMSVGPSPLRSRLSELRRQHSTR